MRHYARFWGTLLVCLTMVSVVGIHNTSASSENLRPSPITQALWQGSNFNLSFTPEQSPPPDQASPPAAKDSSQQKTSKPRPSRPAPATPSKRYAALGDSVAAGLGLPPVSNATASDTQCGRSQQAYPELVAVGQSASLVFAACSGATAGDLTTRQTVDDHQDIKAQLDTAFAGGKPDLITITAGANDIHWADTIRACYTTKCDSSASTAAVDTLLSAYKAKIHYALSSIYIRSNGMPPRVLMTGYYSLGTPACLNSLNVGGITPSEVNWFTAQTNKLNSDIEAAASDFSFVTYVPINFSHHGLCADNGHRWIQDLGDNAPFHPTTKGQQAIARSVEARL